MSSLYSVFRVKNHHVVDEVGEEPENVASLQDDNVHNTAEKTINDSREI